MERVKSTESVHKFATASNAKSRMPKVYFNKTHLKLFESILVRKAVFKIQLAPRAPYYYRIIP